MFCCQFRSVPPLCSRKRSSGHPRITGGSRSSFSYGKPVYRMSDIGVWRGDAASLESTPGWIAQRSEEEKRGEFGPLRDEIRDSMNWSIRNRRFWLNSFKELTMGHGC